MIAATNKDLRTEIEAKTFRDDLYFRLNVVPLYSPALREKREDIPLLIEYFCRNFSEENNFRAKSFAPDALEALAKAGKLGTHATPPPEDSAAAQMLDLARALSTTPVSSELVALDGAPVAPRAPRSVPAQRAEAPSALAPPAAPPAEAPRPPVPALRPEGPAAIPEDLASTLRDIPAIELSDERRRSAEQEVEGLRVALGLHVEEPAFEVDDPCQVSALVVNLERGEGEAEAPDSAAEAKGGLPPTGAPRVRRLARPVEERQYVPPLSAPRPIKVASAQPTLARPPSRFGRVARVAMALLMLLGTAAAAYLMTR